MSLTPQSLEKRTQEIGKNLFVKVHQHQASISTLNKWTQELMEWCLSNPQLKTRLLRFVDVLPMLKSDKDITSHIRAYFPTTETRLPLALRGSAFFSKASFTARTVANLTRKMSREIAQQFICGETIKEAEQKISQLKKQHFDFSLDVLGEAVLSDAEADQFLAKYCEIIQEFPSGTNLSIKLSALTARFDPVTPEETTRDVLKRLLPLVQAAKEKNDFINIDMEQYYYQDLTLSIIKKLLEDPLIKGYAHVGTVIQAYLVDSKQTTADFLEWLKKNHQPFTFRLVKGAYWDSEVAKAKAQGWPIPVFLHKEQTDHQFEILTEMLMSARDRIRVAVASHNIRGVAHALALHETSLYSNETLEFQFLYGMADGLKTALVEKGHTVRTYSPMGPLLPGMAYLVRRILENTSNESFLRLDRAHALSEKELLKEPVYQNGHKEELKKEAAPFALSQFKNEPLRDFSKVAVRQNFLTALDKMKNETREDVPLVIGGKEISERSHIVSRNPTVPDQHINRIAQAEWKDVEEALSLARENAPSWGVLSAIKRSDILIKAAELMRERRDELAALEILETGKTWKEADADVCEAIDFLDYYARGMATLSEEEKCLQVPGETNSTRWKPRGIAAIIAPWNFPLAILTGMTSAALVTGNAALVKPAENSSNVAYALIQILLKAGIPPAVLAFLPGPGNEIGKGLVNHPHVDVIAFTGSKEVGLSILQEASQTLPGQPNIKKVVAELGGKNAIVVDSDADLDEALKGVLASAFGYQGQKCSACSRVILLEPIAPLFLERLKKAAASLITDDPSLPHTDVGPVIDLPSHKKILAIIEEGHREARLLFQGKSQAKEGRGYFIPPTIFTDSPLSGTLSQVEIFGPVLTLYRAHHFEEALEIANKTSFGLTAGLYSRNPLHIEEAKEKLVAGNIYINRKITGAFVGRQPFGGWRLSGTGTKAGGVDYLKNFLFQTIATENTFRHGFPL